MADGEHGSGMTDNEKRFQRAQLQIQIEDAEEKLSRLSDRACEMADLLSAVANKLTENSALSPSPLDFTADGDQQHRLSPDQRNIPSFAEIARMIEELKAARQNLHNLRNTKRQMTGSRS